MKKRVFSITLLVVFCFFLIFSSFYFYLPKQISVVKGNGRTLDYGSIFTFKLENELEGVKLKPINASSDYLLEADKSVKTKLKAMIGFIPIKKVDVNIIDDIKLVPIGKIAGIRILEDGVIVLANENDGKYKLNNSNELIEGDIIEEINGKKVINKETIVNELQLSKGKEIKLLVNRNGDKVTLNITPKYSDEEKTYKLGVWVRDSTQGIGTISYYNPQKQTIGMLGHAILDVDTGSMFNVRKGRVLDAKVTYIQKGQKGNPGEIIGSIYDNSASVIATIDKNTQYGLIGKASSKTIEEYEKYDSYEIATIDEIKIGDAYILSDIIDEKVRKYKIYIEEVNKYDYSSNKGMIIRIEDENLLKNTGGIIQGMSGSPIIQNNKIIGIVTHVFVQDPTKGFAIFIEDMLSVE